MNYFKKKGRPTVEEQAMLQAIEKIVTRKSIPENEIPECHSLDDLIEVKFLVDAYQTDQGVETEQQNDIPSNVNEVEENRLGESDAIEEPETDAEELNSEEAEQINEVNAIQNQEALVTEEVDESISDIEDGLDDLPDFSTVDYDPFSDQIIERSYTSGKQNKTEEEQPSIDKLDTDSSILEEAKEGTPLDDKSKLNPATKRKAAEQTANTILKGYARLAPKPFKWIAKISESKVEKMSIAGVLDVNIEVSEGTSFDDYLKQTNTQIDELFQVEEDTLDEIKEPLIDVLMEQELELTPTQRLLIAVGSHLMQMLTVALDLKSQNNRILNYQKHLTAVAKQQGQDTSHLAKSA